MHHIVIMDECIVRMKFTVPFYTEIVWKLKMLPMWNLLHFLGVNIWWSWLFCTVLSITMRHMRLNSAIHSYTVPWLLYNCTIHCLRTVPSDVIQYWKALTTLICLEHELHYKALNPLQIYPVSFWLFHLWFKEILIIFLGG